MAAKRKRPVRLGLPGGPGTDPDAIAGGVEVRRTADGAGYLVPRSIGRLTGEAGEVVQQLQDTVLQVVALEEHLEVLVLEGRALGVSWGGIGWSVGTTAQAARQRWSEAATRRADQA
jgi:hypothetical protein